MIYSYRHSGGVMYCRAPDAVHARRIFARSMSHDVALRDVRQYSHPAPQFGTVGYDEACNQRDAYTARMTRADTGKAKPHSNGFFLYQRKRADGLRAKAARMIAAAQRAAGMQVHIVM